MKKYLIIILITVVLASCNKDSSYKEIKLSFKHFLHSLETDDISGAEKYAPFLSGINMKKRNAFLKPFRELKSGNYKLKVSKVSDNIFHLQIITKTTSTPLSGIIIPYRQNSEGFWEMNPVIESVRFIDIIPAKK